MRRNFHHQWPKVTSALMGCKEGREGDTISVEQIGSHVIMFLLTYYFACLIHSRVACSARAPIDQ
jgi:hypothetical protein